VVVVGGGGGNGFGLEQIIGRGGEKYNVTFYFSFLGLPI
jgi:hypothetical protein